MPPTINIPKTKKATILPCNDSTSLRFDILSFDGSTYESRVSFDTFVNRDATDLSFTLISKHKNFTYSRRSRTFLCGTDQNDYSEFALEWLVEELVEDGDEIICLRVVDEDSKISSDTSVQQGTYKAEARRLLRHIQAKNKDNKSISLVLDLAVGKVSLDNQSFLKAEHQ